MDSSGTLIQRETIDSQIDAGKVENSTITPSVNSIHFFLNSSKSLALRSVHPKSRKLVRLTCRGDLHDPKFPSVLRAILAKLRTLLLNGKNPIKVTKVEPWNSVRVTLNLSEDAAQQLRQLAERGDENLRDIGILSVQLDGQQVISLILPDQNITNNHGNVTRNNQNTVFSIENDEREKNSHQGECRNQSSSKITKESGADELFDKINGNAFTDENGNGLGEGHLAVESSGAPMAMVVDNTDVPDLKKQQPKVNNPFAANQKSSIETDATMVASSMDSVEDGRSLFHSQQSFMTTNASSLDRPQVQMNFISKTFDTSNFQETAATATTTTLPKQQSTESSNLNQHLRKTHHHVPQICVQSRTTSNQALMSDVPPPPAMFHGHQSGNPPESIQHHHQQQQQQQQQQQHSLQNNLVLMSHTNSSPSQTNTNVSPSKLVPITSSYPSHPNTNKLSDHLSIPHPHQVSQETRTSYPLPPESSNSQNDLISGNLTISVPNESSVYQRKTNIAYHHHLTQTSDEQVFPNQTISSQQPEQQSVNQSTNSSDILGPDVDDDLLDSVAATGTDPNDFTDLNDLNLLSMLEEMETGTANQTTTTRTSDNSVQVKQEPSVPDVQENKGRSTADESRHSRSQSQFFPMQTLPPQASGKSPNLAAVMSDGNPPPQQQILINNPNGSSSSVLLSSSINQQRLTTGAANSSAGPPPSFSAMQQQQVSSSKPQQQPSQTVSSPRQIYVPARTQQSWRTSASQQPPQQSPMSQTCSLSNTNKMTQSTPNNSTTVPVQQSSAQQNRFVAVNCGGGSNGGSIVRQPLSSTTALPTSIQQQPSKPQPQAQQQQIVVRPNAPFSAATVTTSSSNQPPSSSTNAQNAVALSSPLLVNLLQSDVPSNSTLQQQQQSMSSHLPSQPQFVNSPGTQQIRLITPSEANQPIMTQLMMVRVSSAHQGTTTQIINSGSMVPVSSTNVANSSASQTIDQAGLIQADQATDNINTSNNLPTNKPKKPRKPRKKVQQEKMVETSVQTTSVAVTPTTPTSGQVGNISNASDTSSGRIQTSSVSTFLTLPPNSMTQSLKLQSSVSNSSVPQSLLSSPSGAHHIFNQKQRVQPVVMIAANSVNSNMDSSSTSASNAIVSSTGGTFILTNVPAISLQSNTSAMTTTTTSGVQLSGNRKQIFLATKSNSFPVSSALSAGLVARFANSPGGSSPSPSFVSSPVKLIQQSPNSMTNSPMSSTDIRSMSAPAATSNTMLTPPSNSSPSSVMSSPLQSPLPTNANLISNTTSTSNISTMFANTNSSSNNNPAMISTSTMVSFCTNVSSVRTTKSANAPDFLSSSSSQPGGTANNSHGSSLANQSSNLAFKSFQVTKNSTTSLLLNKLSQPNQMITKIGIPSASPNKIPLKAVTPPPLVSNAVQKQFVSVSSADPSPNVSSMDNTFVVKNSETSSQNFVHVENKSLKCTNMENFVSTSEANKNVTKPPLEYKTSLAEMLSNNNEGVDKLDSVFLEDEAGQINEPTTPISPSYFLAPASAFESKADQKRQQSPTKSENVEETEPKSEKETSDSVVPSTTSTPITTSTTTTDTDANSITKSLLTNVSKTVDGTATKTNNYTDSFYVLKRNYSQDLPDHILDDDEEDGDDSDPDDFGFYSRTSHFLSGSIGSIGGGNSSVSNATKPSENPKTDSPKSFSGETKISPSNTTSSTPKDNVDSSCQNQSDETVKTKTETDDQISASSVAITNGDLSQSSDDVKIIPTASSVNEKPPGTKPSKSVNKESIKAENNPSPDSIEEIKPIEIVKVLEPKPESSVTSAKSGNKCRKVAPTLSTINKPANKSRRKAASSSDVPSKGKRSLLVPSSSMDSVNLIGGDSSKEKCPPLINNDVDYLNKKQVFITVKPPHSLSTNTIQISNPNQTIGHILQTDSSASTSSISTSSNQKFRYICIPSTGNKYLQIPTNSSSGQAAIGEGGQSNVLYRVPSHGGQSFGQFVVVKPVMVNDGTGGAQSTTGTQFKLIQNKLTPASGTGTGQPLFIPMMATANNQGVLSVKPNPQAVEPQQQNVATRTGSTNEASTRIEIGTSTSNETADIKINASVKTETKPVKHKEVDTCGIQTDNSANFDLASHSMIEAMGNVSDTTVSSNEAPEKSTNEKNDNSIPAESLSSSEATSPESVSFIIASQPESTSVGNQADVQVLRPKDNQTVSNMQTTPVSRSVHFMLSGSTSSNAASNVVILKTDQSTMIGKDPKDQNLTQIGVPGGSANPIRRQILIAKHVPYNQINSQQSLQDSSQQQTIFATKSNNSIAATKTLPSILRQSKRKNETIFQSTQAVAKTIDNLQTIKTSQQNIDSTYDGSTETDSDIQSTPSSSPFKTQKGFHLTNQSLLSAEEDSISDISDSPSKPRKRARKSKVTTIAQSVTASNIVTIPTIYLNSSFGSETISDKDPNETASNVMNPRNQLSKPAPKRAQRNKNPAQTNPVQVISGESIQMFTNNNEAAQKATNASGLRQTRSNRSRKKTPEQSIMINVDGDSIVASDASMTDQSVGFQTHNLMTKSLSPILTDLNLHGQRPTTSFAPATTQQFNVVSVTDTGEQLVSLIEGSTGSINAAGTNSLLVKRSRKSLPSSAVKPALRNNASITEPISASTGSPAKRRRLTKDVVNK